MIHALLVAAGLALPPADAAPLVDRFAAALESGEPAAFADVATEVPLKGGGWAAVTGMFEARRDIAIDTQRVVSSEWTGSAHRLLVEIAGVGVSRGHGRPIPLPRWWNLEVVPAPAGWRLRSAKRLERRLAEELAVAPAEEIEARLAATPELDVSRFLVDLADAASDHGEEGRPVVLWVLAEGERRRLPTVVGAAYRMVSYLAIVTGQGSQCLPPAQQAAAAVAGSGDVQAIAAADFSVAVGYWYAERIDDAVAAFLAVGERAPALEDPRTALRALHMASFLESSRGRVREALAITQRQRRAAAAHGSLIAAHDAAIRSGNIHLALGNEEVARRDFEEALALARRAGDATKQVWALTALTDTVEDAHVAVRQLEEAIAQAREAVWEGHQAFLYAALAEQQLRLDEWAQAERSLLRALELPAQYDGLFQARLRIMLGELRLRQGRLDEALAAARAAHQHAASHGDQPGSSSADDPIWRSLSVEARALHRLGRHVEAQRAWLQAIDEVERVHAERPADAVARANRFAALSAPYRELADALVDQGRIGDALALLERMRARSLREVIESGPDDAVELDPHQAQAEAALEARLVAINREALAAGSEPPAALLAERDAARVALRQFRSELYATNPRLATRRGAAIAESEGLRPLPDRTAILELVVGAETTLAFLHSGGGPAGGPAVRRLPVGARELGRRVQRLAGLLEDRDPAFVALARELYQLLLAPFEDRLAGVGVLAVVPDGALWRLPFGTLRDAASRPLVERLAVFRSPSRAMAQGALTAPAWEPRGLRVLAIGNPAVHAQTAATVQVAQRGPELGPLPAAEEEALAIGRLYGPQHSRVLTGAAAREAVVKAMASGYEILHLATHGLLDDRAPLHSAVLLATAAGDDEDGLLEMREIADLELAARLVVLSACETGRGPIRSGEGVLGMSWSLLAAGVPTVVVSDWKVDSDATARLMVELHRQLLSGLSPPAALRQAQLAVRRERRTAHDYYWAGFSVVGSGG